METDMKSAAFVMVLNLAMGLSIFGQGLGIRLINGKPVEPGTYEEVVRINTSGSYCTATVVGPKTIITAAHCAPNGATAEFKVKGVTYRAKIYRSNLFSSQDHDLSIGVTDQEITGIKPASIGGTAKTGLGITLLGYGCTQAGGSGGSDGILRYGETVITSFSNFDMVSHKPNGAALCFGDSGGPAFVVDKGERLLLGINSKGNIQDTNYNTRTDIAQSLNFIKTTATASGVEVCGINKNCSDSVPQAPSCQITASPDSIVLGQSFIASLRATGNFTQVQINNEVVVPSSGVAQKTITPGSVGSFIVQGKVSGPGGVGGCSVPYTVKEKPPVPIDPPQCQVTVTPTSIQLGQSVTARLNYQGQVTSAELNGQVVAQNGAEIQITPPLGGNYTVKGKVSGSGGTKECFGSYSVEGPTPNVPNYTILSTYCGDNTIFETHVKQVCLGLVKYSYDLRDISLKELVIVTYRDGAQEIMPLLIKSPKALNRMGRAVEQWVLYANSAVTKNSNLTLETRTASVTLGTTGSLVDVPTSISGRTIKGGQAFNVDTLKKATP
ncbi:MAG: trypsin-like serine protease [Deltaproteobacteria bacterium]|nr:trypsin-like serine protease [Deltaproteobacteria bacterium]